MSARTMYCTWKQNYFLETRHIKYQYVSPMSCNIKLNNDSWKVFSSDSLVIKSA